MKNNKKVLIVCSNGPEPSFGGGQRNILLGKLFESLGFEVDMLLVISSQWGIYDEKSILFSKWREKFNIIKIFQPSFNRPFFPDLEIYKYIKKYQKNYIWIIFRYESIAFKSGFCFLEKSKIIIDFDDFELPYQAFYRKVVHFIRHIFQYERVSKCFYLNQEHHKYFLKKGFWIPNIPLPDFLPSSSNALFSKNLSASPTVLHFVTDYDSFINFFTSNEFLSLILLLPDLKFIFICKNYNSQFANQFDFVKIEWVERPEFTDIYFEKAWMSLILDKKNHGTHVKFIESVYYSTPVVGFKDAYRGYEMFLNELVNGSSNYDNICNQIYLLGSNIDYNMSIAEKQKDIQSQLFTLESIKNKLKLLLR